MGGYGVPLVVTVGLERHHEVEVSLVGVRFALLAHVVARRLREVEAADRYLVGVFILQVDSARIKRKRRCDFKVRLKNGRGGGGDLSNWMQNVRTSTLILYPSLSEWAPPSTQSDTLT